MGTAARASELKHPLGGKTGTTNNYTDAWFVGFSPSVTCGTWIGYDTREELGDKETGARAALPMWMDFMRAAIAGKPDETFPAEGAPKKQLDVSVTKGADTVKAPAAKSDEDDDDDPAAPAAPKKVTPQPAPEPKSAVPAVATPVEPVKTP